MKYSAFILSFSVATCALALGSSDIYKKNLGLGEAQLILYVDASGASNKTLIYCVGDSASAASILKSKEEKVGGIMLLPGSEVHFKNDLETKFADGSQVSGKIISIKCIEKAERNGEKI